MTHREYGASYKFRSFNPFETDKTAANWNLKLCLKSKPQKSVSEAYQQDKPRKARHTRARSIRF